jgi:hypothetical protein
MGFIPLAFCAIWENESKKRSMSKIIDTIEGEPIILGDDGIIRFKAKSAVDGDGIGPSHGDPDYQAQTTLKHNGQYLNADVDQYTVLPPQIIQAVEPIVLGCQCYVTNTLNGKVVPTVIGDVGPRRKIGENSIAANAALGVDSSPTTGGEDRHVFLYEVHPGIPAVVNGVTYELQPF